MPYRNTLHRKIFETEMLNLRSPDNKTIAALYLLTADHTLWSEARRHIQSGRIDLKNMHIGPASPDSYAAREFETGKKQITLGELADREMVSDKAFRLIVQAAATARFGKAVLKETEE